MRSTLFMCMILVAGLLLMHDRLQKLPETVAEGYVESQSIQDQTRKRQPEPVSSEPTQPSGGAELQNAAVERGDALGADFYSREIALPRGPGGHYFLTAKVNGVEMTFLVDTGASDVALGAEHAKKLRLQLRDQDFNRRYHTANGIVRGAPVELRLVQAGRLRIRNVEASVLDGPLDMPLLGMSFLNRLKGYEVRDDKLVLRF